MNSPTRGMWTCRHGVDGRDHCPQCHAPADPGEGTVGELIDKLSEYPRHWKVYDIDGMSIVDPELERPRDCPGRYELY